MFSRLPRYKRLDGKVMLYSYVISVALYNKFVFVNISECISWNELTSTQQHFLVHDNFSIY